MPVWACYVEDARHAIREITLHPSEDAALEAVIGFVLAGETGAPTPTSDPRYTVDVWEAVEAWRASSTEEREDAWEDLRQIAEDKEVRWYITDVSVPTQD